jgi:uncharacterized protein YerC
MSQVSKHKLSPKVFEKIFSLFPQFLGRLASHGQSNIAIDALFSTTEKTMIAKRLATAFMLVKGYSYAEISKKLCISFGTIGKISEVTKNSDSHFASELAAIAKEQAFGEFLDTIGYKLSIALPPKGRNWSEWRRRIEEDRRKSEQPF